MIDLRYCAHSLFFEHLPWVSNTLPFYIHMQLSKRNLLTISFPTTAVDCVLLDILVFELSYLKLFLIYQVDPQTKLKY